MFRGEHTSLNAIADAVPDISLCPKSYGYGSLVGTKKGVEEIAFLVTEYLDMQSQPTAGRSGGGGRTKKSLSLAAKLAKLHSTPAPIPPGEERPKFGFPVTTCCGDTPQDNSYMDTWAEFFAEKRLRSVKNWCEKRNGRDEEVGGLVDLIVRDVVPRLLGDEYDGDSDVNERAQKEEEEEEEEEEEKKKKKKSKKKGRKFRPVVVHGDLWAGNKCHAAITRMEMEMEDGGGLEVIVRLLEEIIFDPSSSYAHSEYEWGIMKLFGGFDDQDGGEFKKEYWSKIKKMEPEEEFDDRVDLYTLYHQLNHYAIFGRSYRAGAVRIMKRLIGKYGGGGGVKGR